MNHLIAKIKIRGNSNKYKKMLSDARIFELPSNLEPYMPYIPDHNLDDDSWFGIEQFSRRDYSLDFLNSPFSSAEYDTLLASDMGKIDFLCSYQNQNEYYFQNVVKSQLINKKMFHFGDEFKYEENSKAVVINSIADAIYLKDKDILYFKQLSSITSVFKGIDLLYREATDSETEKFLSNIFIHVAENFSVAKVSIPNRRRIALALDTLNDFVEDQKDAVMSYIQNYCPDLNYSNDAFTIKSDEELKKLLYGIEQRYYTTPVGNEKRCANSIITIQ